MENHRKTIGTWWFFMGLFLGNLVGGDWNMTFIFPYIGNVIIPTDELIFLRVVQTTNQFENFEKAGFDLSRGNLSPKNPALGQNLGHFDCATT